MHPPWHFGTVLLLHGNHVIDFLSKSMRWFLYNGNNPIPKHQLVPILF